MILTTFGLFPICGATFSAILLSPSPLFSWTINREGIWSSPALHRTFIHWLAKIGKTWRHFAPPW